LNSLICGSVVLSLFCRSSLRVVLQHQYFDLTNLLHAVAQFQWLAEFGNDIDTILPAIATINTIDVA
jgi:hypothetical protein